MRKFKLEPSPCSGTGLKCIRAFDLTERESMLIRWVVTNNYMDSDDYKLGRAAGVFLQGFDAACDELGKAGYAMVEFWCRDDNAIGAFVSHLEKQLALDADSEADAGAM